MHKKVVISLHGVNTRGGWQKELSSQISNQGWVYYPLDFGHFFISQLVSLKSFREKKIKWLRNELSRISEETNGATPSIVVHSFGSYLLSEILKRHTEFKFDRIILTGSIIKKDFDWDQVFKNQNAQKTLNLIAKKDLPSKAAQFLVWGAGNSGVDHFDKEHSLLEKHEYEHYTHSETHHKSIYAGRIIPFLKGSPLIAASPTLECNIPPVDPMNAASWSTATYFKQFVERFEMAVSDDIFIEQKTELPIQNSPNTLVIIVPSSVDEASIHSRDSNQLKTAVNGTGILFGKNQDKRSAILGENNKVYDLPSFIGSFEILNKLGSGSNGAEEALNHLSIFLNRIVNGRGNNNSVQIEVKKLTEIYQNV